jgi:putative protease
VQWSVTGSVDKPLVLTDEASCIFVSSEKNLEQAQNRPLTQEFLEKQFSRLGNTVFDLASLDVNLEGEVMLPVSELNRMRRDIVEKIDKFRLTEYGNRREESASVSDLLPG